MLDNIIEISMLFDFYSELLPRKQREIFNLYYGDNLSLGEIAEEYDLTRQGIHETLKRSEKKLRGFESKLKLVEKYKKNQQITKQLLIDIEKVIVKQHGADSELILKNFEETIMGLIQ